MLARHGTHVSRLTHLELHLKWIICPRLMEFAITNVRCEVVTCNHGPQRFNKLSNIKKNALAIP